MQKPTRRFFALPDSELKPFIERLFFDNDHDGGLFESRIKGKFYTPLLYMKYSRGQDYQDKAKKWTIENCPEN